MEIGRLVEEKEMVVAVPFGDDAEVQVRYVSPEEMRKLADNATHRSYDRKTHKLEEVMDRDEAGRLLGRAAVRGWQGFTVGGEEFPYSPENCDVLMARSHEFSRFVNDLCTEFLALQKAEQKTTKKNSSNI